MNTVTAVAVAIVGLLAYLFSLNPSAGFVWLGLLLLVGVYEGWAVMRNGQTMSEWVWTQDRGHRWFRYVVMGLTGLLMWHFFGPR